MSEYVLTLYEGPFTVKLAYVVQNINKVNL